MSGTLGCTGNAAARVAVGLRRWQHRRRAGARGSVMVNVVPRSRPSLWTAIVPPCSPDERPRDREPQPEPAELPRDGHFPLLERVEDARQHVGLDADAGIRHAHDDAIAVRVIASGR